MASTAPPRPRHVVYGVTVDRIAHLSQIRSALSSLPERPTLRVVLDRFEPASYYARAVRKLDGVAWVIGELLDSSQERSISAPQLRIRARSYLRRLGHGVSIWEVGNELNGNWTGSYRRVAAKTRAAFQVFEAVRARTAITLYANDFAPDHCGDGLHELTPVEFARRYLSPALRSHLDYLLLSYYPTQCGGVKPSASVLASHLRALHRLFPHARLGFGEVGLPKPATPATASQARSIMRWAYSLDPRLPYYVGGYFWWYGAEDALRPHALLRRGLRSAFSAERATIASRSGG